MGTEGVVIRATALSNIFLADPGSSGTRCHGKVDLANRTY